ncbi:hypothetical protein HAX54_024664 [Datura stramonium]|uniref:F-box domain-containing protein n=1 Tax=Datura stramonium TaxID=4076 RepID=A0ABS8RGG7_DATST|nr:hypothetical protein [Datura stramonium]
MPAKGKGEGEKKEKGKTQNGAPEPTSDFYFPREIISNILCRLPVKSLLRFSCVCKQWQSLISKRDFMATHYAHSSILQHMATSSIIVQTRPKECFKHVLLLYKPPESVVALDSLYPCFFPGMSIVGPVNGILCVFQSPWGDVITLWNPAMRMSKMVKLSETKAPPEVPFFVLVGLAFDSQKDDLLILRIFCSPAVPNYAEALVRFDVGKTEFDKMTLPEDIATGGCKKYLGTFLDFLAILTWEETDGCHIDVWIEDGGWSQIYQIGPLYGFSRILGCLWNGDIVVEKEDDRKYNWIIMLDPMTCSVNSEVRAHNSEKGSFVTINCPESLFLIEGMTQVVNLQDLPDESACKTILRLAEQFCPWYNLGIPVSVDAISLSGLQRLLAAVTTLSNSHHNICEF